MVHSRIKQLKQPTRIYQNHCDWKSEYTRIPTADINYMQAAVNRFAHHRKASKLASQNYTLCYIIDIIDGAVQRRYLRTRVIQMI